MHSSLCAICRQSADLPGTGSGRNVDGLHPKGLFHHIGQDQNDGLDKTQMVLDDRRVTTCVGSLRDRCDGRNGGL